jgi:SAM-dependent methyltransferase
VQDARLDVHAVLGISVGGDHVIRNACGTKLARLNFQRLYEYRFRDVDQDARAAVWAEIGPFIHRYLGEPQRVLDPAAGRCEFLNSVPAKERWGVDLVDYAESWAEPGVKMLVGDTMTMDLPSDYFDAIWVSNFLEHLATQEQVSQFLERMLGRLAPGGRIAIMGPNFRYCAKDYFDCADHNVILTHVGVEEHLYAAGFDIDRVAPRFLPYSFRGRLPPSPALTRRYLNLPFAWKLLGKQFLVVGKRPG